MFRFSRRGCYKKILADAESKPCRFDPKILIIITDVHTPCALQFKWHESKIFFARIIDVHKRRGRGILRPPPLTSLTSMHVVYHCPYLMITIEQHVLFWRRILSNSTRCVQRMEAHHSTGRKARQSLCGCCPYQNQTSMPGAEVATHR